MLRLAVLLMIGIPLLSTPLHAEPPAGSTIRSLIAERIGMRQADRQYTCQGELICGIALIPDFYSDRDYAPAWSTSRGPTPQGLALLKEIGRADEDGLSPEDYHLKRLQGLTVILGAREPGAMPAPPGLRADFDLLMTDAAFLLAAHILGGRVNPETLHGAWSPVSHEVDLVRILNDALRGEGVAQMIQTLYPPYAGYTRLRRALADYRRLAAAGGWPRVEDETRMAYADQSLAVAQLRRRLAASGDLVEPGAPVSTFFDAGLEAAVKAFQHRHGIATDGVVGPRTREALNVPVEQRIAQIVINMERWRWISRDLGRRHLAVNIADFTLTMVDEGRVRGTMPVVVGRTYRKTPVFSGTMTYLEFNPYWNIPRRNAVEDILPQIRKDPGYIDRQGIRIFSGWSEDAVALAPHEVDWAALDLNNFPIRLQQVPGPHNALGRVKFMFPNRHAVYLHDTPARDLFRYTSRGFSSGCIRVQDPAGLAAFVLEGTAGWDRARIAKHLGWGERQVVRLQRPIPVHLLYWTAWADEEGTVFFREDIYERDMPMLRALREKPDYRRWAPREVLPGPHPPDVDMDEIGLRVIADPPHG